MIIKMDNPMLITGKWYEGYVSHHRIDKAKGVLRVFVLLDEAPNNEHMHVISLSDKMDSKFADFAKRMALFNEAGQVDTSFLDNIAVKVMLKRGKNGQLYISYMKIDYDYYRNEEAEEYEEAEE
ncbi:hypothetical protein [Clostridium transplantifaecale]|uniref:hypothetical protein n=1 Tax=Clostridium transplantifaecale TaxID=2479838 RepID=UPI000F63D93E|nr:hypothetical protein [Clostridium transplantifaecale]